MNNDYKMKHSYLTGKDYDVFRCIKILNIRQSASYMEAGIFPVDIAVGRDRNGERCFVFYFDKEESKEVYDKWCKHEL